MHKVHLRTASGRSVTWFRLECTPAEPVQANLQKSAKPLENTPGPNAAPCRDGPREGPAGGFEFARVGEREGKEGERECVVYWYSI